MHSRVGIYSGIACVFFALAAFSKPNIFFIMSDDHAAHAISAYGSRINKTPNIDRLANEGVRFNNCFVVNSICTPSRAAILTGKYSHMNGVTVFNPFDGSQPHVAKYFQQAGYQTAMIGKWHLFSDPTGFDYWKILPGQGKYYDPDFIEMGKKSGEKGYVTDIIGDDTIKWIKNRDKSKPFLLFSHHKAPHREWGPAPKYANLYENIKIPEPVTFNDDYSGRSKAAYEATMRIGRDFRKTDLKQDPPAGLSPQEQKEWNYQRYIKDYLRCIASVDEAVGKLLDTLKEEGLEENTLVIYTSDQGFFLGDHGWYDKRFMYEESLRMPFLVRYPAKIKKGSQNDAMVLNVDFAPTFMELAGLKVPSDMQGRSILPLMEGNAPKDWRQSMYYRYYHYPADHRVQPHLGVRTMTHKLIYFDKLNEWELYDLKKDPYETNNVYASNQYRNEREDLRKELYRLKKELNDEDQFTKGPFDPAVLAKVPVKQVFHLDFEDHLTGEPGKFGKALTLTGTNYVPAPDFNAAGKPFTISAWCKPETLRGEIFAVGGGAQGFSLLIWDGKPEFLIRSEGKLSRVRSTQEVKPGEWVHIAGQLNPHGEMRIFVNSKVDSFPNAAPLTSKPVEGAAIGADTGSKVGDYKENIRFKGQIDEVKLFWGAVKPE